VLRCGAMRTAAGLCTWFVATAAFADERSPVEAPNKRLDVELVGGHLNAGRTFRAFELAPFEVGARGRLELDHFIVVAGLGVSAEVVLGRASDDEPFDDFRSDDPDAGATRLGVQAMGRAGGSWKSFEFQLGVYAFRPPLSVSDPDFPPLVGSAYLRFGPPATYGYAALFDMVPYTRGGTFRTGLGIEIAEDTGFELGFVYHFDEAFGVVASGTLPLGRDVRLLWSGTGLWTDVPFLTGPSFLLSLGVSWSFV